MSEVMMSSFANKKSRMFFYTKREILLYKDGTFAYKRKNKSEKVKIMIEPK